MKRLILLILFCSVASISCHEETEGSAVSTTLITDVVEEVVAADVVDEPEDAYSIWTDPCVDCSWYFCPPFGAIWQKQICINNCEVPPIVVYYRRS